MKKKLKEAAQTMDKVEITLNPLVKIYSNYSQDRICAPAKSGKFLLIDWNKDGAPYRTEVYDSVPDDLTDFIYLTWDEVIDTEFKWLFFALGELSDNEADISMEVLAETREKEDECIAGWAKDGWEIVFPMAFGRLYLHNPPMFFKPITR